MGKKFALTTFVVAVVAAVGWFLFVPGLFVPRATPVPVTIAPEQSAPRATGPVMVKEATLVSARPEIDRSDGYLGSESCKKCHEDYFDSWHASYHRTMTQPITPETAPPAIFNSDGSLKGEVYRFRRHQDEFWVEFEDPNVAGKRITRRLVLMTGSHHAHVFWYESGLDKTPGQLQIMYLIDQQRWIPRESFFLRPPNMEKESELGRWNAICCNCHSVHPRTRPNADQSSWDTRVSDFGISCEACHGPGESHVAFRQLDQDAVEAGTDPIVESIGFTQEHPIGHVWTVSRCDHGRYRQHR